MGPRLGMIACNDQIGRKIDQSPSQSGSLSQDPKTARSFLRIFDCTTAYVAAEFEFSNISERKILPEAIVHLPSEIKCRPQALRRLCCIVGDRGEHAEIVHDIL